MSTEVGPTGEQERSIRHPADRMQCSATSLACALGSLPSQIAYFHLSQHLRVQAKIDQVGFNYLNLLQVILHRSLTKGLYFRRSSRERNLTQRSMRNSTPDGKQEWKWRAVGRSSSMQEPGHLHRRGRKGIGTSRTAAPRTTPGQGTGAKTGEHGAGKILNGGSTRTLQHLWANPPAIEP